MKMRMLLFIFLFLLVYGGMHGYIFKKAMHILPMSKGTVVVFLATMVLLPVFVAVCARSSLSFLAVPFAWIGYLWMGFAFLFISFSLILDIYGLIAGTVSRMSGRGSVFVLTPFQSVVISVVIACAATGYGFLASRWIDVENVSVKTGIESVDSGPLRIVQISDLHLGILTSEAWIRRLADKVNALHPDVIVSTGDLIDMQPDHVGRFAEILASMKAPSGKFAVTGNHEAYVGLENAADATKRAGFTMLSNEGVSVTDFIALVGVDDPAVIQRLKKIPEREKVVVERYRKGVFVVLMKHQPVVDPASIGLVDLQLSGHIHGGQIFPFNFFTWLRYRVNTGLTLVGRGTRLYVSRGTGTWGPPVRFMAPSEVTVIDLVPERKKG